MCCQKAGCWEEITEEQRNECVAVLLLPLLSCHRLGWAQDEEGSEKVNGIRQDL